MNLEQTVLQNPQSFIPDESASHKFVDSAKERKKPPKKKNISKQKTTTSTQSGCQGTIGTHSENSPHVSPIHSDDCKLIVPEHFEQQFLETRVPTVVFYNSSFKTCYNSKCKYQWDPKYMQPPYNMLFCMKTVEMAYKIWSGAKSLPLKCLLLLPEFGLFKIRVTWCANASCIHG